MPVVTQLIRAIIAAVQTVAAIPTYSARMPPLMRSEIDLSWNPTRMNASTFSTKTATSHTAKAGIRIRAGMIAGAVRGDHGKNNDRNDSRKVQPLGNDPDAERRAELNDDRRGDIANPLEDEKRDMGEDQRQRHARRRDDEQRMQDVPSGKHAGHRCADGQAVDEQGTGVVEETLA